jgi:hypothetical protein
MRARTTIAGLLVGIVGLGIPVALAGPSVAASGAEAMATHACTRTSSGHCIRGGQFCPQSKYNHSGWDARGRRYVCKGDHTHPHWMKP